MTSKPLFRWLCALMLLTALFAPLFQAASAQAAVTTSQNFDGVTRPSLPAGWTVGGSGQAAWTTVNDNAYSAPNAVFSQGAYNTSDTILTMPAFTAPTRGFLSFYHRYGFETFYDPYSNMYAYYDGGVLEISINGGGWQDIQAAGGTFITGGYGGVILGSQSLSYRSGWVNNSNGWRHVIVSLPAAADGQSVQLRWWLGTDMNVSSTGWWVDDVVISTEDPTTTTLTSDSPNPSTYGSPVTLTAQVQSGGAAITSGTVDFLDGGAGISGCTGVAMDGSGQASCETSVLDAGNHSLSARYNSDPAVYATSSAAPMTHLVNQRALTVTGTVNDKVYDGGNLTTATLTDDRVPGDVLTVTYTSAFFGDRLAGNNKSAGVTGISISGPDSANYALSATEFFTTANITTRPLTVTAAAANKVYDGSAAASVTLSDNRVPGDTLTASFTSAAFNNKNAGTAKTVTVSGISLGGQDAPNYALSSTTASTTGTIEPRGLTVSAAASGKVYDGDTTAAVTLSDNRVTNDVLTVNYDSADFDDKNAGSGKTVTVSGINLSGTDADNYTPNTSATTTASITPRGLTITASGVDKNYDADNSAIVILSSDALESDTLYLSYESAVFDTALVGEGKTVTVSGIAVNDVDAGNYTGFATETTTTADILPAAVTAHITAADKDYDGTTAATLTSCTLTGVLPGEEVTIDCGAAVFDTRNAGNGKTVTAGTLLLGGPNAGNYALTSQTVTTTASVSPVPLTLTANDATRVYGEPLTGFTVTGLGFVHSETVGDLGGSLVFATTPENSPVGDYPLTPSGLTSTNYVITFTPGTLHIITVQSTALLEASDAQPQMNTTVTLTATISAASPSLITPVGKVSFLDGDTVLCADVDLDANGQATCDMTTVQPFGLHTLRVEYSGDANMSGSTDEFDLFVKPYMLIYLLFIAR